MPFAKGQSGNPAGRATKRPSLRELLRNHPVRDKRKLVKMAYTFAIAGDSHWAEWIAKHSGEGASLVDDLRDAGGGEMTFTIKMGVERDGDHDPDA